MIDIDARLLEIAQADEAAQATQKQIDALNAQLKALKKAAAIPDDLREQLRLDIMDYIGQTGDLTIHERITLRHTTKWMYDDDEALGWCEANARNLTKVKITLDKRGFEKALNDGLKFPGAEKVNAPTIAIPTKLGDLLIAAEAADEDH